MPLLRFPPVFRRVKIDQHSLKFEIIDCAGEVAENAVQMPLTDSHYVPLWLSGLRVKPVQNKVASRTIPNKLLYFGVAPNRLTGEITDVRS